MSGVEWTGDHVEKIVPRWVLVALIGVTLAGLPALVYRFVYGLGVTRLGSVVP